MKKTNLSVALFLLLFLLIPLVQSVQVVTVPTADVPEEKSGGFGSMFGFLKNQWFWYAIVGVILFAGFGLCLFFLVRWLVKFIKERNDVFWRLRNDRMDMAKVHRRYASTHWWKVEQNTPIRLAKKDEDGRLIISRPIAHHRGDYVTHEGNLCIWLNLVGKKKWWIMPDSDLLIIPNRAEVTVKQRNEKGETTRTDIFKLPVAKDIVQFNEGEILLFAEGLSKVGVFLIPVLKDKSGKIIDLAMPIYSTLKDVVMGDYLYEINSEFVALSKQAMNLNPNIRATQKVGDPNQNVQIDRAGQ